MRGPVAEFRGHVWTALAGVVFALAFTAVLFRLSGAIQTDDRYRITALVPSSSSLAAGSRVTMAGVEVGRVENVTRHNGAAAVELSIDRAHAPVPTDSRVRLRLRTLIGEKFVEIVTGREKRTVPDGGVLPLSQGDELVEVDEILSQLRGRTRERARMALRSTGAGLAAHGDDLHSVVSDASAMIRQGEPAVRVLARDHAALTRLVSNLGRIAREVGDRGDAMGTLARTATSTLRRIASRDEALRRTIRELPPTLRQVRSTSGSLHRATSEATPVLDELTAAVRRLGPTLDLLRPAATDATALVGEAARAAPPLEHTLGEVRRVSSPGAGLLGELRRTLCHVDPMVRYLAPYTRDGVAMLANLGSAVNAYDANGHIARLYLTAGDESSYGALPGALSAAMSRLSQVGVVHKVRLLGYNPYPAPGRANDTSIGRGSRGARTAENRYVRVQADC